MRITDENLKHMLVLINNLTAKEYEFDYAYGGIRMCTKNGSMDVFNCGYTSKKGLYNQMLAFYKGVLVGKELGGT